MTREPRKSLQKVIVPTDKNPGARLEGRGQGIGA